MDVATPVIQQKMLKGLCHPIGLFLVKAVLECLFITSLTHTLHSNLVPALITGSQSFIHHGQSIQVIAIQVHFAQVLLYKRD